MANETPSVKMLADLREKLKPLNIPIKFKLPKQDTQAVYCDWAI